MKKQLLIFLFVGCGLVVNAQQINETYYKDSYLTKEVEEKKAKFKKVETQGADGIVNIQIFNLSKNCLLSDKNYKDNIPVGVWTTNNENCSLEKKRDFSKLVYTNEQISTLCSNVIKDGNSNSFVVAQYGDNENAFYQYLISNVRYPAEAREEGIEGRVYLQFIVEADGSIKNVSIRRGVNTFLDFEAWELIVNMPKWNPAKKDGQPVDSCYDLPISFTLK
ncbi:MAG: energy transducer TonB [Bacteroidia bacterium]